jgi:DnaJ-class molecular chaperone
MSTAAWFTERTEDQTCDMCHGVYQRGNPDTLIAVFTEEHMCPECQSITDFNGKCVQNCGGSRHETV